MTCQRFRRDGVLDVAPDQILGGRLSNAMPSRRQVMGMVDGDMRGP